MKKITKKTCENGIKCILFIAVGCFVLFMISVFGIYPADAQTWYLIGLLTAVAAVEWAAMAVFLHFRSDEIGETYRMDPLHWFLAALPAIVLGVVLIILYSVLGGTVSFFAVRGGNFGLSFLILLAGTGLCYLFDYAYVSVTKKNTIQQTTVKIVKKEARSKKSAEPSKADEKLAKKMAQNAFDMNDLLEQMQQIKKMGSVRSIVSMLPGAAKISDENIEQGDKQLKVIEAMIQSMTKRERENPSIINPSRKRRIAAGSGTRVEDVNRLLRQFEQMKQMMKKMGAFGKKGKRRMKLPPLKM